MKKNREIRDKVRTQTELADALGVARQTVSKWIRDGAPGRDDDGLYDVGEFEVWRAANMLPEKRGDGSPEELTDRERLVRAMANERESRAELAALKLEIERGEWTRTEEVEHRNVAKIKMITSHWESMIRRLAQDVQGLTVPQAEALMKKRFRELREKFSRM